LPALEDLEQQRGLEVGGCHVGKARAHAAQVAAEGLGDHAPCGAVDQAVGLELREEVGARRHRLREGLPRLALVALGHHHERVLGGTEAFGDLAQHGLGEAEER